MVHKRSAKIKFVQITAIYDQEWGEALTALDNHGRVFSYYNHSLHGQGWYQVDGDDNRVLSAIANPSSSYLRVVKNPRRKESL